MIAVTGELVPTASSTATTTTTTTTPPPTYLYSFSHGLDWYLPDAELIKASPACLVSPVA